MSCDHLWPNTFCYLLLTSSCLAARPLSIRAVIALYLSIFCSFLIAFEFSMEASSVWCWSAAGIFALFIMQPYLPGWRARLVPMLHLSPYSSRDLLGAPKQQPVNSTGAGDRFLQASLHGRSDSVFESEARVRANVNASATSLELVTGEWRERPLAQYS
jgi:hypothetical protein